MERLQILAIDVQSVFEPSLRNLPAKFFYPSSFDYFINLFNSFRIDTELTFSILSLFSRKLISL